MSSLAILMFLLAAGLGFGKAQNKASFGEACSKTVRCNSKEFLSCENETCKCLKDTEMVFDAVRAKCVVLAGERCMYTAMESDGEDRQELRYTEALDCVVNATCNSDGYCGCKSGLHEDPRGNCIPNEGHGGRCGRHEECRKSDNLICEMGKCTCNSTEAVHDENQGKCVGKVGTSCRQYSGCIQNATAERSSCRRLRGVYRGSHEVCECKCKCRDEFYENSDDNCVPKKMHGESCEKGEECREKGHFICAEGRCLCNSTEAVYNDTLKECVGKPGASCLKHRVCVLNAARDSYVTAGTNYCLCKCEKDFLSNSEGQCIPKMMFGESCGKTEECQTSAHFECIERKCLCNETEAIYDTDTKRCISKVGPSSHPGIPWIGSCRNYSSCVPNSYRGNCGEGEISCTCSSGYTRSSDGLCLGGHGLQCDPIYSPCHDQFSCYGGMCACHFPSRQEYRSELGKCWSYVNSPCLEKVRGKVFQYECRDDGAECRDDNGIYECMCKEGYIKWGDFNCRKIHGTTCKMHGECDVVPGANLKCMEGTCSCDDLEIYDDKLGKCLGLMGAFCSEKQRCTSNAYCQREREDPKSKFGICRCKAGAKVDSNRQCLMVFVNGTRVETIGTNNAGVFLF